MGSVDHGGEHRHVADPRAARRVGAAVIDPSQVSWVCPTRGDVNMEPILATIPEGAEVVLWDNSVEEDHGVYGRYMAIHRATRPVIITQDDDCLVRNWHELLERYEPGTVVGNMRNDPPRLRFYRDTTMLGWGAIFDRELPFLAFARYSRFYPITWEWMTSCGAEITFPMLTPNRTIPVDPEWLAQDDGMVFGRSNRMSNQEGFYRARDEDLARAREVRDRLELRTAA